MIKHTRRSLGLLIALAFIPINTNADEQKIADVSGVYAQIMVTTSSSKIPVLGRIITSTKTFSLVNVKQDSRGILTLKENVCNIDIVSSDKKVTTTIPKAFQKAVSGQTRKGFVKTTSTGTSINIPRKWTVFGANLKNPLRDKLPDDDDDKRLVDADRDGHPGLTVKVRGMIDGDLYLVTRGWNELKGSYDGTKGRVKGNVRWNNSQNIVDATSMFLKFQPDSKPDKRNSKNYFRWQKVDAKTSCAQVNKSWRKLLSW